MINPHNLKKITNQQTRHFALKTVHFMFEFEPFMAPPDPPATWILDPARKRRCPVGTDCRIYATPKPGRRFHA